MVKYSHKPQLSHFQRVKNLCWVSGPGRVLTLAFEELCDLGARHLASMSYCHLVHERRKIFNSCMKRVDGGVCLDPWVGMRCILHIFSYHYDKTPNKTTEGRFFFFWHTAQGLLSILVAPWCLKHQATVYFLSPRREKQEVWSVYKISTSYRFNHLHKQCHLLVPKCLSTRACRGQFPFRALQEAW